MCNHFVDVYIEFCAAYICQNGTRCGNKNVGVDVQYLVWVFFEGSTLQYALVFIQN